MDPDKFPLHSAAMRGDDAEMRRLVESGEDVNALDRAGRTVIACAVVGEESLEEEIDASPAAEEAMTTTTTTTGTSNSTSGGGGAGRLAVLRMLIRHPEISLFTLNAPQPSMNGVTPLGMAAWLNMLPGVRLLLEEGEGTVSVDGMDAHGATALMYAARDGSLAVVQQLLAHGARPDFRDANHRTPVQFSLSHPQILWLCELVLRRHRWRESQSIPNKNVFSNSSQLPSLAAASLLPLGTSTPPPLSIFTTESTSKLTNTLIQTIYCGELSLLCNLLFSPPPPPSSPPALYPMGSPLLVNRPDSKGWSPIHHCAASERPSIDVLDALYFAGADVSLFTTREHYTPLHCLARSARQFGDQFDSDSPLYQFAIHLIRNLRAPLSARDKHEETCTHIAAEHGECLELLLAFLDCDITGTIRQLRNARGLTALQVAKPEFHFAFGADADKLRPASRVSVRTIRPKASFASISSFSHRVPVTDTKQPADPVPVTLPSNFDVILSSNQLISNLRLTSPTLERDVRQIDSDHLDSVLQESARIGAAVVRHYRTCTEDAAQELRDAGAMRDSLDVLLNSVKCRLEERLSSLEPPPAVAERTACTGQKRHRDSEDSQLTAVSTDSGYLKITDLRQLESAAADDRRHVSVSTDVPMLDTVELGSRKLVWPEWLDSFMANADAEAHRSQLANAAETGCDVHQALGIGMEGKAGTVKVDGTSRTLSKRKAKEEVRLREAEDERRRAGKWHAAGCLPKKEVVLSGGSKLKAWFRRKILADRPHKLDIIWDLEDDGRVGREARNVRMMTPRRSVQCAAAAAQDGYYPSFQVALAAASRDLDSICRTETSVEHLIESSHQLISRFERILHRALKKRERYLAEIRLHCQNSSNDDHHSPSTQSHTSSREVTSRPKSADSRSLASSVRSSRVSVAPTIAEGEDDDTRVLRRLLLRKLEANVCGALDEIEKVTGWLRIVKETVRGVKRRAYL